MEFLNKIELRGVVGSVHISQVGDTKVVRFTVMTEYYYRDKAGGAVVDCTWFNCTAWADTTPGAVDIEKGNFVDLSGRVRSFSFRNSAGDNVYGWEIVVKNLNIIGK